MILLGTKNDYFTPHGRLSLMTLLSGLSLRPSRILISQQGGASSTDSLNVSKTEVPPLCDISKAVKLIA